MSGAHPILTFHGIGPATRPLDSGEERYWIPAETWRRMVERLQHMREVEITFDDGNASDLEIAARDLQAAGLTATFFVCADRVGARGFLGAGDLRALVSMGMRCGSHGAAHVPWKGLRGEALRREIGDAKDRLEQAIGSPVTEAACPFGAYDRRSLKALRFAEFRRVLTSDGGWARPDDWPQPRTSVRADDLAEDLERLLSKLRGHRAVASKLKGQVKRWL